MSSRHPGDVARPFRHEALFCRGTAEFVAETVRFIRDGLANDEAVMAAVSSRRLDPLRTALGDEAETVEFVDMTWSGRNPATILPMWLDFAEQSAQAGRGFRGVGEVVWPGRSSAALVECRNHEGLLNLAFVEGQSWHLLCPYDVEDIGDETLSDALATHPQLVEAGRRRVNSAYDSASGGWLGYDDPLPRPATTTRELWFAHGSLREVRSVVAGVARDEGVSARRAEDLSLAVNEIVGNSIRHGGGRGLLRIWRERDVLLCEICDRGSITDPLVGRRRPTVEQVGGRGLWMANHSCDLVQIRSHGGETVVRMHTELRI